MKEVFLIGLEIFSFCTQVAISKPPIKKIILFNWVVCLQSRSLSLYNNLRTQATDPKRKIIRKQKSWPRIQTFPPRGPKLEVRAHYEWK